MSDLIITDHRQGREVATLPPEGEKLVVASPLDAPPAEFRAALDRRGMNRKTLMEWVRSALVDGVDFGAVKTRGGMSKPSLRKPGAEKICGMLGVTAVFPTFHEYEQAALSGVALQHIVLRCHLQTGDGRTVSDGVGARSLAQDNDDLNKALKMAAKSAHIDATLRMAGLSEIFTQDIEDMPSLTGGREVNSKAAPPPDFEGRVPRGKHQGKKWEEVSNDYLDWCVNKADSAPADLKEGCRKEMERRAAMMGGPEIDETDDSIPFVP